MNRYKLTNVCYGPPKRIDDTTYRIEVMSAAHIADVIAEAISVASGIPITTIQFEFNGVTVSVCSDSDPELIFRDWERAFKGCIDKNIGPLPNLILTEKEKESDARIEAENERKRQERRAQYEAEASAKREAVDAKLAEAPKIDLADENIWKEIKGTNQDSYGSSDGVVVFAERWARLMQREMANGKNLEDVAETTSREADTDGITGAMYGHAVRMLAHCWKYGEQLRRWHNLEYQIRDEGEKANESGGVLDPASLNFG